RIVEVNLETRLAGVELGPGHRVEAWTYDGGLPGPLIRVNVGDRLIVHYRNSLPEASTIHWHGIRVPIEMDGVPGISQPPVAQGESFTYDFIVPDAGLYWYHPHVMSAAQVGFGVYGPLLVEDPSEKVGTTDQLVIVLSDIGIHEHGQLEDPESGGTTGMAFGREGNFVLTNGHLGTVGQILARSGAPQRWRILNAAKSRYFSLDLEGQEFLKIGADGGIQEYPVATTSIVLGPAERADVIVRPTGEPGSTLPVRSYVFNRGYGSVEFRPAEELLFTITFTGDPAYSGPPLPEIRRSITPYSPAGATPIRMALTLDQLLDGTFQYGINNRPFWEAPPFEAKLGETQVWTLVNETAWSHPFHLHGFFFLETDEHGTPLRPLIWKDTLDVPFKETRYIIVNFPDRPGEWMIHCHILDHVDGGLMGVVNVGLPPSEKGKHRHLAHPHDFKY
ncbi:MAG: multicopper oxidase family protein, partial [Acidimicrobiia bacterium]|nr:multicopper oxidase family protein [Acidimicrobiia bacterium]